MKDRHAGSSPSVEQDLRTRLERAQTELDSVRRELEHAHALATLGTLTAGIAHEINNILTPVLAYAQLARSTPQDHALCTKAIDRAIAGAESASRITEAVLGFARGDDGGCEAEVDAVVDAALACVGRDPARDGVRVATSLESGLTVRIRPLALQQVLLNLIINAIRAMRQTSGGDLRITARAAEGGSATITITDTGPGIPREIAGRAFEPFVTGHPGSNGTRSGSGLGLAVSKRLIESAGGTISVESQPGHGASFTIALKRV
jgi:signal transduction histidine kinase